MAGETEIRKYALMMSELKQPFVVVAVQGDSDIRDRLESFVKEHSLSLPLDRVFEMSPSHYMVLMKGVEESGSRLVVSPLNYRRADLVMEQFLSEYQGKMLIGFSEVNESDFDSVSAAYSKALKESYLWKSGNGEIQSPPVGMKKSTKNLQELVSQK